LEGAPHVLTDDGLKLPLPAAPRAEHGARVVYGTRPEHFALDDDAGVPAEVRVVEPTGSDTQVALRLAGHEVVAQLRERIDARPGDLLRLRPQATLAHVFDAGSGLRLN